MQSLGNLAKFLVHHLIFADPRCVFFFCPKIKEQSHDFPKLLLIIIGSPSLTSNNVLL
uniref:Uncharacterized protein n=1 Tax=Rhizophora mucronata TaxID=61149 RepID=A0A2P2N952_RHIMU